MFQIELKANREYVQQKSMDARCVQCYGDYTVNVSSLMCISILRLKMCERRKEKTDT
jgi:hypothetical protein